MNLKKITENDCTYCEHFRDLEDGEERLNFLDIKAFGVCKSASSKLPFSTFGLPWFCYEVEERNVLCKMFIKKGE